MVNLGFQANVFLFAEFELKVNDLFLFSQISNDGTQFRQLGVDIVSSISITANHRRCGVGSLLDASGLRAD